jgi:hypothetical protein
MASGLARMLAVILVTEELAEDNVLEQVDAMVGDVYDPTKEFE